MDPISADMLDECIYLVTHLQSLQDEDSVRIACALRGDQLHQYRHMLSIEQEKLSQLKNRLYSLGEAIAMLTP